MGVEAFILHTASLGVLSYGIKETVFSDRPIDDFIRSQYGGHLQFLTILGLIVTSASLVAGIAADMTSSRLLRSVKRALLMVAMPMEAIIASIYWTLLCFFPNLILREEVIAAVGEAVVNATMASTGGAPPLARIPLSVDLSIHAIPGLVLVADFLLFEEKYRDSASNVGPLSSTLTLFYAWWVELCAVHNGGFPYPLLTLNTFEVRLFIYAGSILLAYTSFLTLNAIHK